ncbi:hypothetical protein ACFSTC_07800 [Nonomuraea ferruginea]
MTLRPGEWTVLRAASIEPDREERQRLEFTVGVYPVSVTLAQGSYGFPDVREEDDFSWATALGALTAVVLAALLLRALGGEWWQRTANRELAAGLALAVPVVLLLAVAEEFTLPAYVMLFGGLPLLALRHAVQVLPTGPQWTPRDALGATGVGVLLAVGMLSWSYRYGQLPGDTLLTGSGVAAVAAAGSAVVLSADLGVRIVVVRLAAFAAGSAVALLALALWGKALATQVYPPDSVRLLLAFCWALIPVAAVAVAIKQWTRGAAVVAVVVSLMVQGWPSEWLDAGSWSREVPGQVVPHIGELELTPAVRGVMGLLLLGFLLLVLRLRRLGSALDATRSSAAEATMIICLMVAYLAPQGSATLGDINVPLPMLSITALIAWVTARWLLTHPHPSVVEPGDQEEHRELIRSALHRRLLLASEQELYRAGRGRIGTGELSMEEFGRQRDGLDAALQPARRPPRDRLRHRRGLLPLAQRRLRVRRQPAAEPAVPHRVRGARRGRPEQLRVRGPLGDRAARVRLPVRLLLPARPRHPADDEGAPPDGRRAGHRAVRLPVGPRGARPGRDGQGAGGGHHRGQGGAGLDRARPLLGVADHAPGRASRGPGCATSAACAASRRRCWPS